MEREFTSLEVIGLAVRIEESSADFYDKFALKIKNGLVSSKYRALAFEERRHREMLIDLYHKLSGLRADPPSLPQISVAAEAMPVVEASSVEELLNDAIKREEDARKFYADAAMKAANPQAKNILFYLADAERGHAVVLKIELEALTRDKDWYSESADIQLVGP